jgi:hypothetical protein
VKDSPSAEAVAPEPPRKSLKGPSRAHSSVDTEPVDSDEGPDCLALARQGQSREAVACFSRQAQGSGLAAELALYEIARLRRNVLADPEGALDALRLYQRRFGRGSLTEEVDVSVVELLTRLGRSREALVESEHLLSTRSGAERVSELRLLRGNIYRNTLDDCAKAEGEYAVAATSDGPSADEAQFLRAGCLSTLGRKAEAIAAYRQYLGRPHPQHQSEATARLRALAP